MKKHGITGFVIITFLASLAIVGCQPSQSSTVEQGVEPVTEIQIPQQTETKPAPTTGQRPVKPAEEVAAGQHPKIVLVKASHDFGKIGPGSTHKAGYEFKNEGESALLVQRIQSTCGCSRPTLIKGDKRFSMPLKKPIAFEPGESGKVEVTFKAPVTKGKVNKNLYILSNDPASKRTRLVVKAEVIVKVSVQPEKVDLRLDLENAGMPDIVVKSTDGQEFSIKSATVIRNAIKIPFDPAAKATEFTLKPQVDFEKISQFGTAGIIQIRTTHPQAGTLMVRYTVLPSYELKNPRYILQNVKPGEPILRDNLIRSNYGKKVEIESITSRNGYMEVDCQEQDGDHMRLTVKITPPSQKTARRYITDELTIILKDGHKLTIRCSGWFRLK